MQYVGGEIVSSMSLSKCLGGKGLSFMTLTAILEHEMEFLILSAAVLSHCLSCGTCGYVC